ncbi:general transcription factor IIF subunit 1 isoform X2 [Periplaneta americana]|uniref:general transcription factor IIF subunit 1 isoform X2 n=1 Tax=Periplaneta americana TaxID=6978 RepID=UPI0037E8D059
MSNSQTPGTSVQEYSIRVPKNTKKKYQVMRFTSSVNIDFSKWTQVKMERENNMKEFRGTEEEMPKFGAGSEFGRDAREEARRKKYGIVSRKYRPEDQPWILKVGGKTGKKFRGNREGGVAENASYYVFTHAPDGAIEAFPLQEWYNFQPIQRYKSLSAEEAEEQFGRRNKLVNYFSLMLRQRLRPGDEEGDPEDPEEGKTKKSSGSSKKELKISDMDEWIDSDDDDDESDSDEEKKDKEDKEEKDKKKKKKKEEEAKKKKKKRDSDDEAFEESDDGDEEGRELDYISDSSDSVSEPEQVANKELKGVAEEDALRKLLSSGEEDEEEQEEKEDGEKDSEAEDKNGKADAEKAGTGQNSKDKDTSKKTPGGSAGPGTSSGSSSKKKKKKKKKEHAAGTSNSGNAKKSSKKDDGHDSSSALSSDSSDSDNDSKKKQLKDVKGLKETNSGASSRSATPTKDGLDGGKRKLSSTPEPGMSNAASSKRARLDNFSSATLSPYYNTGNAGNSDSGITEDAVRRYLMRKPMTTTELLQKFKSKKTGLTSDQLVNIMTQILKRINPVKQTIKGKMYLSIKA